MSSSKTTHRFQAAFTLVELLVVIAIVAILVALLFPLVGSMRRSASSAISVSNLGKIGTAIVTYAADNNGTLPGPAFTDNYSRYGETTNSLTYQLRNYLPNVPRLTNNTNMRYCPTFDYPAARTDAMNPNATTKATYAVYVTVSNSGGTFRPLGYPTTNSPPLYPPMTTAGLAARDTRGKRWITETDRIIRPGGVLKEERPPHGNYRNTLMFDYSVQAIPLSEFIPPAM